jgi:hypothetical protein
MIAAASNSHCPYCGGHQVIVVAHDDNLSGCRTCGRAWLSHCPTCGSDNLHAETVVTYWPTGLPHTQTTAWKCWECGESWTDEQDDETPVPLVYVTVVGLYRDLARMSGDFQEEFFCVLGSGSDTETAIADALRRELRGSDFNSADLEVLAVFGGWHERLPNPLVFPIIQALEDAEDEKEEEEEEV